MREGELERKREGVGVPGCEGLQGQRPHFQAGQRRTCTPLFLKAVPVTQGVNANANVPLRMHFFRVSREGS